MAVSINGTTGISGVDGSAGTPALQGSDTNTGISFGTDEVNINTGGTERVKVDSSGNVGVGTTSPFSDAKLTVDNGGSGDVSIAFSRSGAGQNDVALVNSSGEFVVKNGVSSTVSGLDEALRVDASGRLLVGTTTPDTTYRVSATGYTPKVEFKDTDVYQLALNRTNGACYLGIASKQTASSGAGIGGITFNQWDGGNLLNAASILAAVDGTPGANDMPGRLVFSTTADGAASPTEALVIDSEQRLVSLPTYNATSGTAANVGISSTGKFFRSTSSIRYKTDVETMEDSYADAILNCRPVWYRSTSSEDPAEYSYWGFIAEEVSQIDERLVTWGKDEDGKPREEGVQYDRFVPHLLNLIKRQQQAIETLEAKVAALEGGAS